MFVFEKLPKFGIFNNPKNQMKLEMSLQDQKLRFIETFMRIDDDQLIAKLNEVLIRESNKKSRPKLITDLYLEELDSRWLSYKKKTGNVFTFEQTKQMARKKIKAKSSK
ncbi:MAG: hypothetical protein ACRCYO_04245 [Bacteroidia bacterium]